MILRIMIAILLTGCAVHYHKTEVKKTVVVPSKKDAKLRERVADSLQR